MHCAMCIVHFPMWTVDCALCQKNLRTVLSAGFSIFVHWKVVVNTRVLNLRPCTRVLFPVNSHNMYVLRSIYLTLFYLQIDRTFPWRYFCPVKILSFSSFDKCMIWPVVRVSVSHAADPSLNPVCCIYKFFVLPDFSSKWRVKFR